MCSPSNCLCVGAWTTLVWAIGIDRLVRVIATGDPFFFPSYVGPRGWIGIVLGETADLDELAELVEDSYRLTAPKRLLAELDQ